MKRWIALSLALVMMLALCACGQKTQGTEDIVYDFDQPENVVVIETPPANATPNNNQNVVVTPFPAPSNPGTAAPAETPAPSGTDNPSTLPAPAEVPAATPTPAPTGDGDGEDAPPANPGRDNNPTATDEEIANGVTGYVIGDGVNFRVGPGSDYRIIDSYPLGKQLTILGASGGWNKVIIDGVVGYMYSAYVSEYAPGGGTNGDIIIDGSDGSYNSNPQNPSETPDEDVIIITP